ncbi:pyridoxamine 5'-phosphate oxidase family protein [Chloroflexi bacterium TSY]|nr:pyridoxamine 5'-phosphate oxidase family protein [Chloroflexi bacterium TSY]
MTIFDKTTTNRVQRLPDRGHYDTETIHDILDEALICHVGFVQDGQPYVIPTLHARQGDNILLHGSSASRMIRHMQAGNPVCITVTLMDGIVLARSVFHHSINYRSVLIFGHGQPVEDEAEKSVALKAFTEKLIPGRWADARQPTPIELKGTGVVSITVDTASAKVRTGPPKDDEEDYALPVWAGVLPVGQTIGEPVPDQELSAGVEVPDYIRFFAFGTS